MLGWLDAWRIGRIGEIGLIGWFKRIGWIGWVGWIVVLRSRISKVYFNPGKYVEKNVQNLEKL